MRFNGRHYDLTEFSVGKIAEGHIAPCNKCGEEKTKEGEEFLYDESELLVVCKDCAVDDLSRIKWEAHRKLKAIGDSMTVVKDKFDRQLFDNIRNKDWTAVEDMFKSKNIKDMIGEK